MYSANCTVSPASPVTSINNLLLNLNILSWSTQTTFIVIHWPVEGMREVKPLGTSEAKLISPCFIRKYKSIWKGNVAHWVIVWELKKFSSIRATLRKWSEKILGKISAQPHTTLCIQFLDWENNDKNNRLPLGKQICFTIVWGCAEILPNLIWSELLKS